MLSLAEQLVAGFLTEYRDLGVYSRHRIERLAELATDKDRQIAESATKAFFTALVERLADSFEPDAVSLYNRAFAQIIQAARGDSRSEVQSKLLNLELEEFGLYTEEDLIARAETLRSVSPMTGSRTSPRSVRRVIVLSRVTLGADVAITSVIIERMKLRFPSAEIVLVGGTKVSELFGGDSRLRFKEIRYLRGGTTIERLLTWIDLLRCVRELTDGLTPGECLIVDPDSRLTQLGLLPVARTPEAVRGFPAHGSDRPTRSGEYLFFPSRAYRSSTSHSLSELTSMWIDEVFVESLPTYPSLRLRSIDIDAARAVMNRMRRGTRPVISINFGVGENQFKRVGGDFEASLVSRLVQQGAAIVLDKGAGEDEVGRVDGVIADATRVEREGRRIRAVEISEDTLMATTTAEGLDAEILIWNGRIGMLAGLIGESDLYIGYDSAGQHIAAALGVSCIDIFAGYSSPRMLDRWRPTGRGKSQVVAVDTMSGASDPKEVLAAVVDHVKHL